MEGILLKITDVTAVSLVVPIQERMKAPISLPYADELGPIVFGQYRTTLVRIKTDEGIEGVGECMVRLAPTATREIVHALRPVLVGKDPYDVEVIWERLYGMMMNRGHDKGFYLEAVSGIDIALWDIMGKAEGKPVAALLGGIANATFPVYASSVRFRGFEQTLADAKKFVEKGYRAIKIKVGQNPRRFVDDIEVVRTIRGELGSDIDLMVDANCGYDVGTAVAVGRKLEELDVRWFEEPIAPDDLQGYELLQRKLDIPIAGGETQFSRFGMRDILSRRLIDIVQPNVSRAGGFTECRKIAALASAFHVPYAPHTGSSSAICIAASMQLAAALPTSLIFESMESDWSKTQENPLRQRLAPAPIATFSDGNFTLDQRPGLGVTLNEEIVAAYTV